MFSRILRKFFSRKANRTVINRQRRRSTRRVIIESLEYRVLLAAQVMTDLPDYAPGSTALVSTSNDTNPGTNFSIDEIVAFHIDRTDGIPIESPPAITDWLVQDGVGGFDAYRDGSDMWIFPDTDPDAGEVGTSWYVDPQFADASLRLTATGQSSGAVATHEFTDSVTAPTITATNPNATVASGGTISLPYNFSYVTGGSGANLTTAVTYNVYLRKGSTNYGPFVTQSVTNLTAGTHNVTGNMNVTFNGLGSNPPSTASEAYRLRIEVTRDNGGGGSNPASQTSTNDWVTVAAASGSVASVVVGAQTGARTYGDATGNVTYSVDATRAANGNFVGNYSVSGLPNGVTGSFNPVAGSATGSSPLVDSTLTLAVPNTLNAGSYNFTITLGGVNGSGTLLVNKASAAFTVTPYTLTYDGVAHTATVGTITGVNGETGATVGSVDLSGTTHTNAGTYNNDPWTFTGTSNYNNSNGTVNNAIAKATATVNVTNYTGTYDGVSHTASVTITGVGNVVLASNSISGTNVADSGSTTASITGNTNYNDASGTATLTINKANAAFTVTPYSVTYDGTAHTATVGTITGVNGETGATVGSVDLSGTTHTNAGTYNNDPWTFTGTANYNISNGTVNNAIAKATATVNVTDYSGTYDGVSHTASVTIIGVGTDGTLASNSISGTNVADSGSTTASITGLTNYNDASGTATLTINKANATFTVTPYSVTGDGSAYTATVGTITGVNGETGATVGSVDLSGTTHTNVGTYNNDPWTFTGGANYNNSNGTVNDTIIGRSMSVDTTYTTTVFTGLNAGSINLVDFVDSQALSLPTTYRATIDWGDGQVDTNVAVAHSIADGTTISVIGSHVYTTNGTYYPIITLVDAAGSTVSTVSTNTAKLIAGTDVSNKVSVTRSSVVKSRVTGLWSQTVKINNISGTDLTGNIDLWIIGLTTGVTLSNASASFTSEGIPYLRFSTTGLKAGKSVSAVLSFAVPSMLPAINYTFKIFNH